MTITKRWTDEVRSHIQEGEPRRAIALARRISIYAPEGDAGYSLQGNAHIHLKNPNEALRAFERTVLTESTPTLKNLTHDAMARELVGDLPGANRRYREILDSWPNDTDVRKKHIRTLFRSNSHRECLRQLAQIDTLDLELLFIRGASRSKIGNSKAGLKDLEIVTKHVPNHVQAWEAKAYALTELGSPQEAINILDNLRAQTPNPSQNEYYRARAQTRLGETTEARNTLSKALIYSPNDFHVSRQAALTASLTEDHAAAARLYRKASIVGRNAEKMRLKVIESFIKLRDLKSLRRAVDQFREHNPVSRSDWNDIAIKMKDMRDRSLAIEIFEKASTAFPDEAIIFYNLGHTLNEESRGQEAVAHLKRALILRPNYPRAWSAMSVCQLMYMAHDYAERVLRRALCGDNDLASAWLNLGIVMRTQGKLQEAIEAARHSIKLNPKDPVARPNLAYTLLMAGEIEQGLKEYDSRWMREDFPSARRPFKHKIWEGQPVADKGVLVYMEQGMGDELMFSWYLHRFLGRPRRIAVECDPRLIGLFSRTFPDIEFIGKQIDPDPRTAAPDLHYKIPVGHLPKFYWYHLRQHINRVTPQATRPINRADGHLIADPQRRAHWRRYLDENSPDKIKVGICWRSGVRSRDRDRQYLNTTQIASPFDDRFAVYNLQYDYLEEETSEIAEQCAKTGATFFTPPDIDLRDDLDDLTALCAELDIVITPLISTAFMAGAVGTPVWVFRSSEAGCTWHMMGTSFVPWFPSMRMFFRDPRNPWTDTLNRVRHALDDMVRTSDHSAWRLGNYQARK